MIRTIFFDLDCTLLPMDQDKFIYSYFSRLTTRLAALGYDRKELQQHIWNGTMAMMRNDGSRTNETVFWDYFAEVYGERAQPDKAVFDDFYRVEFQQVQEVCGVNPEARQLVEDLRAQGYALVLATNPLFPAIATESRIRWAGLEPDHFIHRTTYENASYAKPNPAYYQEILDKLGLRGEECLMVGNDAEEDMAAEKTGMRVFLLTDYLINAKKLDISVYPQGGYPQLREFIRTMNN